MPTMTPSSRDAMEPNPDQDRGRRERSFVLRCVLDFVRHGRAQLSVTAGGGFRLRLETGETYLLGEAGLVRTA